MELNEVIELIEDLLIEHNYVTVPQFGGFVVRESDFNFNRNENKIEPKKRLVAFNKKLNADDGILVLEIAKRGGISQKKAKSIVDAFSNKLFFLLNNNQQLGFGNLGEFRLNSEGNIQFIPNDENNLDKSLFGLEAISIGEIPTISNKLELVIEQETSIETETEIIEDNLEEKIADLNEEELVEEEEYAEYSSESYSGLWAASITFILGALFTFILTEPDLKNWESSFNPIDIFRTSKVEEIIPAEKPVVIEKSVVEKPVNEQPIVEQPEEKEIKEEIIVKTSTRIKESEANYFIIGGSFKTLPYAEKGVAELKDRGFHAEILPQKNLGENFRIAIDSAYNLKQAQEKELTYKKRNMPVWVLENF
ncbi:MAG: hypothetical protein RIR51_1993 [Bacteroidota bacterium]